MVEPLRRLRALPAAAQAARRGCCGCGPFDAAGASALGRLVCAPAPAPAGRGAAVRRRAREARDALLGENADGPVPRSRRGLLGGTLLLLLRPWRRAAPSTRPRRARSMPASTATSSPSSTATSPRARSPAADHARARDELQRRLLDDAAAGRAPAAHAARAPRTTAAADRDRAAAGGHRPLRLLGTPAAAAAAADRRRRARPRIKATAVRDRAAWWPVWRRASRRIPTTPRAGRCWRTRTA